MKLASLFLVCLFISSYATPIVSEDPAEQEIAQLIDGFVRGLRETGTVLSTCEISYAALRESFKELIGSVSLILSDVQNLFVSVSALRIYTNTLNYTIAACNLIDFTSIVYGAFDAEQFGIYLIKYFTMYEAYTTLVEQGLQNFNDRNFEQAGEDFGKVFAGVTDFYLS